MSLLAYLAKVSAAYIACSVCQVCHSRAELAYAACAVKTVLRGKDRHLLMSCWFVALPQRLCLKTGMPVCRYTLFIPLYPIGMLAEMQIMLSSLPYLKNQKLHSISLPNTFNFGFDYHLFIQVYGTMLVCLPCCEDCNLCVPWCVMCNSDPPLMKCTDLYPCSPGMITYLCGLLITCQHL